MQYTETVINAFGKAKEMFSFDKRAKVFHFLFCQTVVQLLGNLTVGEFITLQTLQSNSSCCFTQKQRGITNSFILEDTASYAV